MRWKTLSIQTLVDDYHATVKRNKVELPDGAVIEDFGVIWDGST